MSLPKIVLLGMLTKIPVGGVAWLVHQYADGFARLGYDVYYVEAHGRVPSMFMEDEQDDGTRKAVDYLDGMMNRFGLSERWAYHAVHDGGEVYGMSRSALEAIYADAVLIVNMHGGTVPLEEHSRTGCLVYLGTDPVETELEIYRRDQHAIDFLKQHDAFFTWGLNYGNPDCKLPYCKDFPFLPSPPPVVIDLWHDPTVRAGDRFTTIGNWRQEYRSVAFDGEIYTWSKHLEFLKFIDVPGVTGESVELALSSYGPEDSELLQANGWRVRPAEGFSNDPDSYREYIHKSRGEFTVAKDQNVRFRTGWFSERSAQYLAAGRPVVTQDTGFSNVLPTGSGLFGFTTVEDVRQAFLAIADGYPQHCQDALEIAREHFNYDVVLPRLLSAGR